MANRNCGCSGPNIPPDPASRGTHILLAATGSEASRCGTGAENGGASEDCLLTDPQYDVTLSDFSLPAVNDAAPVLVCNGAAYRVGLWVQFGFDGSTVQVTSIQANYIYVRNGCANGQPVKYNSPPGTLIKKGTPLVVVAQPPCRTPSQETSDFSNSLAGLAQICVPALTENASTSAMMQLVAWKQTDADDDNFRKCIYRIKNFFVQGVRFFWKNAITLSETDDNLSLWRQVYRQKTTGELRERLNFSERVDLIAGKKYVTMVVAGAEQLVGPAYIFVPVDNASVYNFGGTFEDDTSWVSLVPATPVEQTVTVDISAVNAYDILGDDFYVILKINLGSWSQNDINQTVKLYINNIVVARTGGQSAPDANSLTLPIKVTKADKNFTLKLVSTIATGVVRTHCDVSLVGLNI